MIVILLVMVVIAMSGCSGTPVEPRKVTVHQVVIHNHADSEMVIRVKNLDRYPQLPYEEMPYLYHVTLEMGASSDTLVFYSDSLYRYIASGNTVFHGFSPIYYSWFQDMPVRFSSYNDREFYELLYYKYGVKPVLPFSSE